MRLGNAQDAQRAADGMLRFLGRGAFRTAHAAPDGRLVYKVPAPSRDALMMGWTLADADRMGRAEIRNGAILRAFGFGAWVPVFDGWTVVVGGLTLTVVVAPLLPSDSDMQALRFIRAAASDAMRILLTHGIDMGDALGDLHPGNIRYDHHQRPHISDLGDVKRGSS